MNPSSLPRRDFLTTTAAAGVSVALGNIAAHAAEPSALRQRTRVGVIGCGSVSQSYLPHLSKCAHVELVSTCDIIPERAQKQAEKFGIPHDYPHIDAMLAGAPFDLLVVLTDMQEHERLNRIALTAGKHVWSEKPLANSYAAGRELLELSRQKGVRLWGAPTVVNSPQFAFMAKTIASGALGHLAAAHAEYGHEGPGWSAFFYEKGGGSMPDLAVYNLASLTGLLGPAKAVVAMTSIITPERTVSDKGKIKVEAEDNAMLLLDHGRGVISHVQSGFNYFNPHGHDGSKEERHTIAVYGSEGAMGLVGYDWGPRGVDLATKGARAFTRHATDSAGYLWQQGASLAAECLATGKELLITPEHALHIVEVMEAARRSQESGQRIPLTSVFKWPIVA